MVKVEGYWNVVPKIKKIVFPVRGKIGIVLADGREIIMPISAFPSIKKVPVSERKKWYLMITSTEEQTARVKSFIVSLAFQTRTTRHKIGTQNSSLNGKL